MTAFFLRDSSVDRVGDGGCEPTDFGEALPGSSLVPCDENDDVCATGLQ